MADAISRMAWQSVAPLANNTRYGLYLRTLITSYMYPKAPKGLQRRPDTKVLFQSSEDLQSGDSFWGRLRQHWEVSETYRNRKWEWEWR
jgi:hypothetical protein